MSDEFLRWGLDVIAKVGFGTDYNVIFEAENPFLKANQLVLSAMTRCVRFPLDKFNPMSRGFRQDARAAVRFLRKTGRDVVEKRLAARSNGEYVNEDDIIGHMLKASDYLKNPEFGMEDILDEFVTLFLAGHETTANTVAFMLMELIRNQDILDRLRTEIEDVLCGRTEVEFEDLTKLSYMSQVREPSLFTAGGQLRNFEQPPCQP
ncbi:cholesterol 24-hydroxylase-like [Ptychodera flava]|uniref:cholesterol 24-hydroxylase-like n=1 Tax=Ptychodera flava TaxID=63121 RepID=UPI003969E940